VHQHRECNIGIEVDPKRYGRKTKHLLTHPERGLFIDKVGANTSQNQDGQIGGRELIIAKGTWPQE
jgi:hypothetical protein